MANHGYNQPSEGTTDWHIPLNENFQQLERDVEIRDLEANMGDYTPDMGAKFLATDSGATYVGDGSNWNLVGYVTRAGGGDFGHYVNYESGVSDEPINTFFFESNEVLEVVRASAPVKGLSQGSTNSDVTLRVYEGGTGGSVLLEVSGNEFVSVTDSEGPWVASESSVVVTISNAASESVDVVPKVWANIRR
jgi:hypothetical protein